MIATILFITHLLSYYLVPKKEPLLQLRKNGPRKKNIPVLLRDSPGLMPRNGL
jgi:hypothetical protein